MKHSSIDSGVLFTALLAASLICFATVSASSAIDVEMCAEEHHPFGHLLANLNRRGQPTVAWVPKGNFFMTVGDNKIRLKGSLKKRTGFYQDKIIDLDFSFTNERSIDKCFCGSQDFVDYVGTKSVKYPNYNMVQYRCTGALQRDPYVNPNSLDFCPKCENDQCRRAREVGKAPAPVYQDWRFFKNVTGGISGDGVPIFRQKIHNFWEAVDPNIHACTPTIDGLPSAQFYCSDMDDPENGRGYGVNGKNQKCGLAIWFNCEEDIPNLNAVSKDGVFRGHVADINLNFKRCPPTPFPTSSPTDRPTLSPTTGKPTASPTTPEPTASPTGHPTKKPTVSPSSSPTVSPTKGPSTEMCKLIKEQYEMYDCVFTD